MGAKVIISKVSWLSHTQSYEAPLQRPVKPLSELESLEALQQESFMLLLINLEVFQGPS